MNIDQMRFLQNESLVNRSRLSLFAIFVTLVIGLAGITTFAVWHWNGLTGAVLDRTLSRAFANAWELSKKEAATRLWAFSKLVAVDDQFLPLFSSGNRDRLRTAIAPWFQTLRGNRQLVRLDFIGSDRRVFLRAAGPGFGDQIDSEPLREAERTREATTGLVAGAAGIEFDLVVPLLQGGKITGFLDLGVDFEGMLKELKEVAQADVVLLLRKDFPDFSALSRRPADWNRFPDLVVAAESRSGLAAGLALGEAADTMPAGQRLRVTGVAISDSEGHPIGRLDAILDDTERTRVAWIALATFLGAVLAAGSLAIATCYLLLYRVQPTLRMSGVERQNMERMSMRDGLTGLYNRSALDELLRRELTHAFQANLPLSVMFVGLDEYRQFNRLDGKDRGLDDKVAMVTADTLQHQLRLGDVAVRLSGDSYALVVQRVGGMLARDVAERLRRAIAASKVEVSSGLVAISACIGVSCYPEHGKTAGDLIRTAEQALAMAKGQGRGQARVAEIAAS